MINALRDAIFTKATDDETINELVGGVHSASGSASPSAASRGRVFFEQGPNDPTNMDFPYSVYSFIDDVPAWGFGSSHTPTGQYSKVRVQLDHISDSDTSIECANLQKAWRDEFDRSIITVTGYTVSDCIRVSGRGPYRDGTYWRATDDYIITIG